MSLCMCLPFAGRPVAPKWAVSLATISYPPNLTVHWAATMGMPIAQARQRLVEVALERKADYLFFLDDDVIFERLALQRLMYSLQNADPKAMAIGGIYPTKQEVPLPVVFKKNGAGASWDWKVGEVFEVEGIGAGFLLVKTEVFQHLEKPWFEWDSDLIDDGGHYITTGEDIYFCNKVRAAGFKVLADGGVVCMHWANHGKPEGIYYELPQDSYPFRVEEQAAKNP